MLLVLGGETAEDGGEGIVEAGQTSLQPTQLPAPASLAQLQQLRLVLPQPRLPRLLRIPQTHIVGPMVQLRSKRALLLVGVEMLDEVLGGDAVRAAGARVGVPSQVAQTVLQCPPSQLLGLSPLRAQPTLQVLKPTQSTSFQRFDQIRVGSTSF